jgi:dGTPase
VGAAMMSLRSFMFERVYLGPHTRGEHDRARAAIRAIVAALADRGDEPQAIVEYVSGMTDRFALEFVERL